MDMVFGWVLILLTDRMERVAMEHESACRKAIQAIYENTPMARENIYCLNTATGEVHFPYQSEEE
jgi:hypothetical protein